MIFNVPFSGVFQRIGRIERTHVVSTVAHAPTAVRSDPYGLVLYFPNELNWLTVKATATVNDSHVEFVRGPEGLERVYRSFKKDFAESISQELLESNHFLSAVISRSGTIRFEFSIDTNDDGFCDLAKAWVDSARQNNSTRTHMPIVIAAFALDAIDSELGTINLTFEPITPPEYNDGYIAIDFGTTTTALAYLPHGRREVTDLKVLSTSNTFTTNPRGQLTESAAPTETRFKLMAVDFKTEDPESGARKPIFGSSKLDDHPGSAHWEIGRGVDDGSEGLVLGPKRLAASPFWNNHFAVTAYHTLQPTRLDRKTPLELKYRHPAELFICRMLQKFCEANSTRPINLAITYPTTYSSRELRQIKEVVARAWLRMRILRQTDENIRQMYNKKASGQANRPTGKILLALDEATAASFCFLHEKISAAGALPRFNYLYPKGMNLLLLDYGGGTTDVALVHAKMADENPNQLAISVRARSGLRGFGGDNITTAVFAVLKAKIAFALWSHSRIAATMGGQAPTFPNQPVTGEVLTKLLETHADKINQLVPTRFAVEGHDDWERGRNRALTLFLWERSELLKQALNNPKGVAEIPSLSNEKPIFELAAGYGIKSDDVATVLQGIRILRWEVDVLINEPLIRGIKNTNNLIRRRLIEKGEEVHAVVAAGNASRYPYIRELLLKNLNVQFIQERFTQDLNNLKFAVAKGAALALGAQEMRTFPIRFDSDLSEKLPFDIAYWDGVNGVYRILFVEGSPYVELTTQTLNFAFASEETASSNGSTAPAQTSANIEAAHKWFVLYQRWPGDEDDFEIFGRYHFPNDVQSPVTISYNNDLGDFIVSDAAGPGELRADLENLKPYRSPPERGDM